MTEAALILPFFLTAGLGAIEVANYSLMTMKVGQLAAQVADNASRIGDYSTLENRKIYEGDIDDLLQGAAIQSGAMDLYDHGRVIVSSLEVDGSNNQYIHWQRCMGKKVVDSSYGKQGDVMPNGMGPAGSEVTAIPGDAVIFVEVQYDYQPLIGKAFFYGTSTVKSVASFMVRDSRDLSQIYQSNPGSPDPVYTCDKYTNPYA